MLLSASGAAVAAGWTHTVWPPGSTAGRGRAWMCPHYGLSWVCRCASLTGAGGILIWPSALRDQFCPEGRARAVLHRKEKQEESLVQGACAALRSGQRSGLVTAAFILGPCEETRTCREKCRGCKCSPGCTAAGNEDQPASEVVLEAGSASEL